MNNDTKHQALPSLISDVISGHGYLDNLFADAWKALKFGNLLKVSGFTKRTGIGITEVVFLLLIWKWLNVSSIAFFSRSSMSSFTGAKKDVLYDALKREDINWRDLNLRTAKQIYRTHELHQSQIKTYVLDDTIKIRRGKKMEAVSSHFDHTAGKHVMGQQVLTLGLATEDVFLPLDAQIYVSSTKAQGLIHELKDGRSIVAKRYQEALQSKPVTAASMLKRAKRMGLDADYLVADAWFGTKAIINAALDVGVCPVLRMTKGMLKYRFTTDKYEKVLLTAQELYSLVVKTQWRKVHGLPWKSVAIEVELDMAEKGCSEPVWQRVKLVFVRGLNENSNASAGKKDWALFLTTDTHMSTSKILEIYSLRWGIEVYFKEAKQHLGFMDEQTWSFASHTASVHLCAIRYLMLVLTKLEDNEASIGEARDYLKTQLNIMSYASSLWRAFRSVIFGALNKANEKLTACVEDIMQILDGCIHDFITNSLQLDLFTLQQEQD